MYAPLFRQCYRGAEGGGTGLSAAWQAVGNGACEIVPDCYPSMSRLQRQTGQNLPERARTMHELDRGNKARRTLRARATMFPIR